MKISMTVMMTTVACMFIFVVNANAGELFSPPVSFNNSVSSVNDGNPLQYVFCDVTYIGDKESMSVSFDVINFTGDILFHAQNTVGPNQRSLIAGFLPEAPHDVDSVYCHFTVEGNPDQYRGAIKLRNKFAAGVGESGDVFALPAY